MKIIYLFTPGVLINDPLIQRSSPVLYEEGLRVLLALAVTETSLCLRPRDQVVLHEIHFQIFTYFAADLCLRTPGATIFLLSYSVTTKKQPLLTIILIYKSMLNNSKIRYIESYIITRFSCYSLQNW